MVGPANTEPACVRHAPNTRRAGSQHRRSERRRPPGRGRCDHGHLWVRVTSPRARLSANATQLPGKAADVCFLLLPRERTTGFEPATPTLGKACGARTRSAVMRVDQRKECSLIVVDNHCFATSRGLVA